ncbi:MAG: redoxin domain-containing protein [Hymenobacter sp.]
MEEDFSLDRYLGKRYVLLFFYPADFSSLCPTELLAFQQLLPEFERRGVAGGVQYRFAPGAPGVAAHARKRGRHCGRDLPAGGRQRQNHCSQLRRTGRTLRTTARPARWSSWATRRPTGRCF